MSHSHIPLKHLLKQVEIYRHNRQNRDARPDWITRLINDVAELFEPLVEVGRVGFDCEPTEDRWLVGMYLGKTELVGGREDGEARHIDFEIDLLGVRGLFSEITEFRWNVFPEGADGEAQPARSVVTIEGSIDEKPLRLQLYSVPPRELGPALRKYPDGRYDPV